MSERPGGMELPPGLRWTDLSLDQQQRIISRKMADVLYTDTVEGMLSRRLEAYGTEHLPHILTLRNELKFKEGVPGGDGDVLPELFRRGAHRDALETLGKFLGFRLERDPETKMRLVRTVQPMTLKAIREQARVPNIAEANLLVGLNVFLEYLEDPLDDKQAS